MQRLMQGDVAVLQSLELDVCIGIHDWERTQTQRVLVDLEMGLDAQAALASDRIEDTVNYETVAGRIREAVTTTDFYLLERLGAFILQLIADEFHVQRAVILLRKPHVVPHTQLAGVRMTLGHR